ncbi:hypothetical protein BCR32DRAFT_246307 [Anaeromyces robustus]|jgi:serine/threonine protein kinase|uniref:Protein kinase domain-containing protein n=1 Tax=Anaeromyces robustus TaxID=1754192 RepID=A0A1Y1X150_9FUNG|nr:hypothetical protein BCR32DRAFT_246307 [Anaeromyces robustus]|eukprot:ORX79530.1 hypothetical protein BCR32DRAFT_246307 [Anaeromyces robustus]
MQKYWPERRCHGKENIWYAINTTTQEKVILKYFTISTSDDYKVSREAYTMKYLYNEDPKHFLQMFDFMEDRNEDQYTIAMERAECSLEDIVNERGYLPEEEAIPILREILKAIKVMHKNNFIHRDLKLSNILLRNKNDLSSVTIIDFGETLDRTDDYYITGMVGTLHYMAPEILKKKKYGKAVDLWAYGVIAYRLLTGYFPFIVDGENHSKQLKAILQNGVSYLRGDNQRLSIKAIDFINNILDPEPHNRIGIDTALEHPFLNLDFQGEFAPYKPLPKFSKKMAKDNVKESKFGVKGLFSKAVKIARKQDPNAESEKIIKTLFKNEEDNTEETPTKITYSKTTVQPNKAPQWDGAQTINRIPKNHHNNNVPEYLNVTLGRKFNKNQQYTNQYKQYTNSESPVSPTAGNSPVSPTAGNSPVTPTAGNSPVSPTAGNVQINITEDNINEQQPYGYNQIRYSKTYSPHHKNYAQKYNEGINYSNTYQPKKNDLLNLPTKLPKTAGNSIVIYPDEPEPPRQQNMPENVQQKMNMPMPVNTSNELLPSKTKTAGNTIYTYDEFQDVIHNNSNDGRQNRHNRAYSDSTHRINNNEEYYQNYGRKDDNGHSYAKDQFKAKYTGEIGKSNTHTGTSHRRPYSPILQEPKSPKSDGEYEPHSRHHRKTSSSSSNQYDKDTVRGHRKTNSSSSNHSYEREHDHRRTSSNGSSSPRLQMSPLANPARTSPKMDYSKPYSSIRPSPLANAATIKTSNSIDDKYRSSLKHQENSNKENIEKNYFNNANMMKDIKKGKNAEESNMNMMDIKLRVNMGKNLPKVITVDHNHPSRNSSLFGKNKK